MFLCSELMSSTRLAALSTCWGKTNLQMPTICRKACWWSAESKNAGRQDIMTPASWVGRSTEGQTVSKHSSCQGTEWKWWPRPLGKDNPGRYSWAWGYGARKFLGTLRRALSASVFEHFQCLFSSRIAYSNSKECPSGCIASSASPGSRGEADDKLCQ